MSAPANPRAGNTGSPPPGAGAPRGRGKPKFKLGWFKVLLILIGLLVILSRCSGGSPEDKKACLTALGQGNKLLARGDVAGAGIQSANANAYCRGDTRAKAEELQTAVAKAENSGTACSRALKTIDGLLDNHQLDSARNRLDKLDKKCAADAGAKKLRQRLSTAQSAANSATDAVRRALNQRDAGAAAKALDRLNGLNRDSADLPGLRAMLASLQAEQAAAVAAAPAPEPARVAAQVKAPAQVQSPGQAQAQTPASAQVSAPLQTSAVTRATTPALTRATTPAPQVTSTTPQIATPAASTLARSQPAPAVRQEVHNAKAEMAVSFIQDAETALSQSRFDAARTYLDSARRMDPNSPRLDTVGRQIRDRERQMMQQETTIR